MAKKVTGMIKLQVQAGKANPAPPIGLALGQHGVNIPGFCKEFNERTKNDVGLIIPVVITVYSDRSFTFITKDPAGPGAHQEGAGSRVRQRQAQQDHGSASSRRRRSARSLREKMPDLNAANIESAMSMVKGYRPPMGVTVADA